MDPDAALEAIREALASLGHRVDSVKEVMGDVEDASFLAATSDFIEHVRGLVEWLDSGGFLPGAWQRDQQATALGKLILGRKAIAVGVHYSPFDLPDGYVEVGLDGGQTTKGGFTAGIAPDGSVSS